MNKDEYKDYLKSPSWRVRSDRWKKEAMWCEQCRSTYNLQVHHLCYDRMPYNELRTDVQVLCEQCHTEKHEADMILKMNSWYRSERIAKNV
jgi:5-methylcytosine-specific restriction endonuclease McrA